MTMENAKDKVEIKNFHKNIMGTLSFDMKLSKMRKPQEFIVYPVSANDADKPITIQSDTRIGVIDLSTGRGLMSQSHSGGAYFVHLSVDEKIRFRLDETQLELFREKMRSTSKTGDSVIKIDNAGASEFRKGGHLEDYTIDMVKSDLKVMEEYASKIASLLDKLGYVEPWIASKIYIAGENIENIKHYLEYEVEGFPTKK
jgi:hypothetical protein